MSAYSDIYPLLSGNISPIYIAKVQLFPDTEKGKPKILSSLIPRSGYATIHYSTDYTLYTIRSAPPLRL